MQSETISILIATRNRPEPLRACLTSVLACKYGDFEVIVVDQGESPCEIPPDPRLRYINSRTRGKSTALNVALGLATGRYLAFTDDDCTVGPGWIAKGVELLATSSAALVFCPLVPRDHDPNLEMIPAFAPRHSTLHTRASQAEVRAGAGANMFARRELFDVVEGFDELLGPGARFKSCEEFDLYYRALRAGFSVMRSVENPVLHWGARSVVDGSGDRLLRDYWYGEACTLAKHAKSPDLHAIRLVVEVGARELYYAAADVVHRRRRNRLRTKSWLAGFCRGLSTRLDVSRRFFADGRPRSPGSRDGTRDSAGRRISSG